MTTLRNVGNGFLPTAGGQTLRYLPTPMHLSLGFITEEIGQTSGQKSCYWEQNREQRLGWMEENKAKYLSLLL